MEKKLEKTEKFRALKINSKSWDRDGYISLRGDTNVKVKMQLKTTAGIVHCKST